MPRKTKVRKGCGKPLVGGGSCGRSHPLTFCRTCRRDYGLGQVKSPYASADSRQRKGGLLKTLAQDAPTNDGAVAAWFVPTISPVPNGMLTVKIRGYPHPIAFSDWARTPFEHFLEAVQFAVRNAARATALEVAEAFSRSLKVPSAPPVTGTLYVARQHSIEV